MITLENFSLSKNNNDILKNINFVFDRNTSLIGTSSSGKTSLLKVLEDKYKITRIYKNDTFYQTSIEDELKYLLLNVDQKKLVSDLLVNVNLGINANNLKNDEKIKLNILKALVINPEYVSFDGVLDYLKKDDKEKVLKYLNKNSIKYIIVSNDLNNLFYTDFTYILNEGSIVAYGPSRDMLLEEKLLKRLGFSLPFMVDLSLQLRDYNLVKMIYLDKETMVNVLWK